MYREPKIFGKADPYVSAYYFQDNLDLLEIISGEEYLSRAEKPHVHDEIEMLLITGGDGFLKVNGVDSPVGPGSLVWLFPFHVHALRPAGRQPLRFYYCRYSLGVLLYLKINKQQVKMSLSVLEYLPPALQLEGEDKDKALSIFTELVEENQLRLADYEMLLYACIMRLLSLYGRQAARYIGKNQEHARPVGWNALQYIQFYFNRDIDSARVAEVFGISVSELNGALRLLTGRNFSQNLGDARIRNACAMMQFQALTLPYIAQMAGYSSLSAFYRQFKERKGMTPDEYRSGGADGHKAEPLVADSAFDILCYINDNYREQITAATAARALFASESTLTGILHKNFNCTFSQLLHFTRMWVAAGLLLGTDIPVCDIAVSVGFNSNRTFTRAFSEEFGSTPTAFRKSGQREGRGERVWKAPAGKAPFPVP